MRTLVIGRRLVAQSGLRALIRPLMGQSRRCVDRRGSSLIMPVWWGSITALASYRGRLCSSHGGDMANDGNDLEGTTGPIDYLVVEFPGSRMTGEGLPLLVDLVDRGIIKILDLTFVKREQDGSVVGLNVSDLDSDGRLDLTVFEGASSGLLGQDDISEAGSILEPGSSAGILVYENSWAAPFAAALRRGGAQLVASGRIPVPAVLAALDAAESTER